MLLLRLCTLLPPLIGLQTVAAQAPAVMSMCDYYTTAIFKNNSAVNQLTLLTLIVNTVVIGNYTKQNIPGVTFPDLAVPGILAAGTELNQTVDLLPYFNGGLASTNRRGLAMAINFLDDGGVTTLMMNYPANGTSSNQYSLMTHLYEFFGLLLGCSKQGQSSIFPSYGGMTSQFEVHRFMALDTAQVRYFIVQVFLALRSWGFSVDDSQTVSDLLTSTFAERCSPNATVVRSAGSVQQSICIANDCMPASNPVCSAYPAVVVPGVANSTLANGLGNSSNAATSSFTGTPSSMATSFSPASPSDSPSSSPGGLSDGAKIGIGVGVGVGFLFILLLAALAYFFGRRAGRALSGGHKEKATPKPQEPGVATDSYPEPGVAIEEVK